MDVNDPRKGWIVDTNEDEDEGERREGSQDEGFGGKGLNDPIGPPPDQTSDGGPDLQKESPEVQVDENPIVSPKNTATTSAGIEAGASGEEPIIDVVGNIGEGASPNHSPVLPLH